LRPGLTADLLFRGDVRKGVLFIPLIAVFRKQGKDVVYVQTGNGYQQRAVTVDCVNESSAAITGIPEGTLVTLRDPTAPVRTPASGAAASGGLF